MRIAIMVIAVVVVVASCCGGYDVTMIDNGDDEGVGNVE